MIEPDAISDDAAERLDHASTVEWLTFLCGGRHYAVDVREVGELRGWSVPTPLPHFPPYMLGMVNLRGSILPVLDLGRRLGGPATPEDPRNVIVVVTTGGGLHGLLVEAVSDIVRADADALQAPPPDPDGSDVGLVEKLLMQGDTIVQILAVDRVLPERVHPNEAAGR
ncbi:MAG: chemotaxis protein CheW [Pseudomonadota bacterium]